MQLDLFCGRRLKYCSDDCLKRYLEARNWNVEKSKKMLENTLKWRSTYKPEDICWGEVAMEGETGKCTELVFVTAKNTSSIENQIRHQVYSLEIAMLNLPQGQEQMSWLIDFSGWSLRSNLSTKSAKETINILQNHYPERLAIAFWKIVKFMLDSKTMHKVKFVYHNNKDSAELMKCYFDEENIFPWMNLRRYDSMNINKTTTVNLLAKNLL